MTRNPTSARTAPRRIHRLLAIGLTAVAAAIAAALGLLSQNDSSSANPPSATAALLSDAPRSEHPGALGEAGGAVPEGVTVFDDGYPAVTNLDADLLRALRAAATDAGGDGVTFYVNSGWRSPERQTELLREAVAKYGSQDEAARWVATADTSPHVSGDAVDIGRSEATTWLSEHGAGYGLCRIYRNEPWHYELRPHAADRGCPRMYADPTEDPRMRR